MVVYMIIEAKEVMDKAGYGPRSFAEVKLIAGAPEFRFEGIL